MTPERAKAIVDDLVDDAKRQMYDAMEAALYAIARLPNPADVEEARRIAQKCLGIGPYWDTDFPPPIQHTMDGP